MARISLSPLHLFVDFLSSSKKKRVFDSEAVSAGIINAMQHIDGSTKKAKTIYVYEIYFYFVVSM